MTATAASRLGAIVLAGGRSSRFGRDKLAELVDGRPLLHHAIAAVQALAPDIDVVAVVTPGADPELPPGARLAHDELAFEGPLAGLAAGLQALDDDVDRVIVVGGDMPDLVQEVMRLLVDALDDDDGVADAAILQSGGRPRPLPMAVRRAIGASRAGLLLASGERRLRAFPEALGARVIAESTWRALDPDARSARDVDLPGDLGTAPNETRPSDSSAQEAR